MFYDPKIDLTQRRSDMGFVDIARASSRQNHFLNDYTESWIDENKASLAKSARVGKRVSSFVVFNK